MACLLSECGEIHIEQVFVETVLKRLGGQEAAHTVEELPVGHTGEFQRRHRTHHFHQMGRVMLVANVAGVVVVGNRRGLVAKVEDGVHVTVGVAGERFVVVLKRTLRFHHEVGFVDALALTVVEVEVGQHGESADRGLAQEILVAHVEVLRLANVFHQNRETSRACAAEYAADEENAVALAKHVGKRLKFFAVLNHVECHRTDVGRSHETDVHLVFQLVVGK